jgi:transcriptional regulator with XRE-family HTH domain
MLKELIESEMKKQGLSNRDLAKRIDVSHTTIIRAARGTDIDLPTLIKFANWLHVKPSSLLNSLSEADDQLADKISLVIQRKPKLAQAFTQAIKAIEAGEVEPAIIEDIAAYAAYKINLR